MRRQAAAAVTAALVTTSFLAAPATSAEYAGPTITSPVDGKVVDTAQEAVKAGSEAPFVRFQITEVGTGHGITAVVPVATDCTTTDPTSCTCPQSAPVAVDVDAPADTFAHPGP